MHSRTVVLMTTSSPDREVSNPHPSEPSLCLLSAGTPAVLADLVASRGAELAHQKDDALLSLLSGDSRFEVSLVARNILVREVSA